jgi:hypothetical protein
MKNRDQKPESEIKPAKALSPFTRILGLEYSDEPQGDENEGPKMRNRLAYVNDVEVIEKKNQTDGK